VNKTRILNVEDTSWLKKGPHQQHHLMERLNIKGHQIRVIDYEITWRESSSRAKRRLFPLTRRLEQVVEGRTCGESRITLIRPSILEFPLLDYASMLMTHSTEIYRQIVTFKPDVVVGWSILNSYAAMKMAKGFGVPFVFYAIDLYHNLIPEKALRRLGGAMFHQLIRKSDLVLVITEALKEYAISHGANPKSVGVVPGGIDQKRFNPNICGEGIRQRFQVRPDEVLMLFMGHLYDFTGVPEVARNLSSYNDNPRIKLMVLGKGKMLNELVKLKDKLGDKFILLDWIPYMQLPEYVAAADVCILPAFNREVMRDIVPIKIYEYLASGKAVVATKLPALFEEFGSDNGIVFVDDQQGVIPAVQALAQDKEALKSTGLRGASFVAQYRWENLVNDFEQILLDLVRT